MHFSFFLNISFRSRDIQVYEICKLAKWWRHILNQILIKYDEKRYLSQFETGMFDSLQWGSTKGASQYELKILLPWQHTGFQTSPILKAFVATFSVLFSYLRMVPRMYDPTGK